MATSRLSTVNFGLSKASLATVGYTLYNPSGTTAQARKTTGVVEFGTATGVYGSQVAMPEGGPFLVLWDTGEATPRYGSEDNNNGQIDTIQSNTDLIRLIWNSLKNQGAIFSAILEKIGLLEKNKGLVKQDVQEIVNSIKMPVQQEIKFPEFPVIKDYSTAISDISAAVKALIGDFSASKSVAVKVNTLKIEQMLAELKAKVEAMPSYDTQFSNMRSMINDAVTRLSTSVQSGSAETRTRTEGVVVELKKLQNVFARFDGLMERMNEFSNKLNNLDSNDKALKRAKDSIQAEIQRLNILVNTIALIDRSPKMSESNSELIRAFGGR